MSLKPFVSRLIGWTLAALLLMSCGAPQATPTPLPTATPTPEPTATPTPSPPSAQEILTGAVAVQKAAESFHFAMDATVVVTGAGLESAMEMPITFVGDFQAPDRLQGSMKATVQGTTVESALVVIGKSVYLKDPRTGKWVVSSGSAAPLTPQAFTAINSSALEGLKLVGEERVGGSPAYHLAGKLTGKANFPLNLGENVGELKGTLQTDYWIDKENSQLLQVAVAGTVPMTGTVEATVAMSVTIRFSDYGSAVLIEAPQIENP